MVSNEHVSNYPMVGDLHRLVNVITPVDKTKQKHVTTRRTLCTRTCGLDTVQLVEVHGVIKAVH